MTIECSRYIYSRWIYFCPTSWIAYDPEVCEMSLSFALEFSRLIEYYTNTSIPVGALVIESNGQICSSIPLDYFA